MARAAAVAFAAALAALLAAADAGWHQCGAQAAFSGPYGYHALANLSEFRSGLLSAIWPLVNPEITDATLLWKRYDPFNPFLACPPEQPLRRVGSEADGGKLICDVSRLQPPCVIYSLGSNGDYSFENEMLERTQCEVHTFDCFFPGSSQNSRHRYHDTCLGSPSKGKLFKDYDTVLAELGHTMVDFLKIDIEGHEPSVLQSLRSNRGPLPRQIAIEMHTRAAVGAAAPGSPAEMALLFYHLATLGYGIVSREDNMWGLKGCCSEFTFLLVEQHHRHQRLVSVVGPDGQRVITPLSGTNTGEHAGNATKRFAPGTPVLVTVGSVSVVGEPLPPGLAAQPARANGTKWGFGFGRRLLSALLGGGGGGKGLREPATQDGPRSLAIGTWAGPPGSD